MTKMLVLFIIYNQILIFPECCNATVNVVARFGSCYWWMKSGCSVKGTFQDYKKRDMRSFPFRWLLLCKEFLLL